MFYVYIVTNKRNGTLYTGQTDDLAKRMIQHQQKTFRGFSAKYNCHRLVWFEKHETRETALTRERQIKNWRRDWKLNLIEMDNPDWLDISILPCWPLPEPCHLDILHAVISR
ncbi:MAG: GIY-YIG nuclease family protein [Hellea sp.]|nr:GIY-YIG nuclease family protein [Hellea sp.]